MPGRVVTAVLNPAACASANSRAPAAIRSPKGYARCRMRRCNACSIRDRPIAISWLAIASVCLARLQCDRDQGIVRERFEFVPGHAELAADRSFIDAVTRAQRADFA